MSDWERHHGEPAEPPARGRRTLVVAALLVALGLGIALTGPSALETLDESTEGTDPDDIPIEEPTPPDGRDGEAPRIAGDRTAGAAAGQLPELGEWRPIATAPLGARDHPATVWTGEEVLVVGGLVDGTWASDGAAWDPVTDSWRPLPPVPISFSDESSAVWTGQEMIVVDSRGGETAAYDPVGDRWRSLASQPSRLQGVTSLAWDGTEVIVVGPVPSSAIDTAAVRALALDPESGTWRRLAAPPVRGFGVLPQVAVVDGTVVALGRAAFAVDGRLAVTRYERDTDSWSAVEAAPFEERTNTWLLDVDVDPVAGELVVAGSVRSPAWRFHAATWSPEDGWRTLAELAVGPHQRPHVTAVPAGPLVVFPVSVASEIIRNSLGKSLVGWVHTADGWRPLPQIPPAPRAGAAVVWTGQDLFVWSGNNRYTVHHNGFRWRARDRTVEYCCSP